MRKWIAWSMSTAVVLVAAIVMRTTVASPAQAADEAAQPATAPVLSASTRDKLASLEAQFTKMEADYDRAQVKALANDPFLAEAWRRIGQTEKADRAPSDYTKWRVALDHLGQQEAKSGHAWQHYRAIAQIYFSRGMATMTGEQTDRIFLHDYFVNHPALVASSAADLAKRFPDLAKLSKDTPSAVWDAYLIKSPALAESLEKEGDQLYLQYGLPGDLSPLQKAGCALAARNRVYWWYAVLYLPPDMVARRKQLRQLRSEIDALKTGATQPSTDRSPVAPN